MVDRRPPEQIEDMGRESFDARIQELRTWWSAGRFAIAWDMARQKHPKSVLIRTLGAPDGRVILHWRNGHIPGWMYLKRIDRMFRLTIDDNWTQRVSQREEDMKEV